MKKKTTNPAIQPSRHCPKEDPLPDIPVDVTHVYTRQHKTTGLQPPFEGPFRIASRPSRSTVQLEVGVYNNGEPRYEIRHLNDLRLAHPESLAAPAVRPKLGRPSATVQVDVQTSTEATNQFLPSQPSQQLPKPPPFSQNKQAAGRSNQMHGTDANSNRDSHATSSANDEFQGVLTGPPPAQPFGRPVRRTRNPNPVYVDSFWLASALQAPVPVMVESPQ